MKNLLLVALTASVVFVGVVLLTLDQPTVQVGSVETGQEYQSVSLAASAVYGATASSPVTVKTRAGSLGSLVITGAADGVLHFYDATTTDASARTVTATTSLLIATIPASLAAGTYVFDLEFTDGLIVDLESGSFPTSTITYR